MSCNQAPYVVMDVGSGWSKLGFAGNLQPTYTLPTVLAYRAHGEKGKGFSTDDLDFVIGEDALNNSLGKQYAVSYPVEDWDSLERYYEACLFNYLRICPEEHCLMLTEPVAASTEARQQLAEVMFETFSVSGLYLGVQPLLALYAAVGIERGQAALAAAAAGASQPSQSGTFQQGTSTQQPTSLSSSTNSSSPADRAQYSWRAALDVTQVQGLDPYSCTGVVVDVGEGSSSVLPVVDGFVAGSCGQSIGVGGRDLTSHIQQALRVCNAGVPPDMSWEVACKVKEAHCFTCADPSTAAARLASRQAAGKAARTYVFKDPRAGRKDIIVPLGPELFTATELLLSSPPASASSPPPANLAALAGCLTSTSRSMGGWQPLPQLVDHVVQACPIDVRRPLYGCVALSGGTTCCRNFDRRLQADLHQRANARLPAGSRAIDVRVSGGSWSKHAAWLGGSLLAGGCAPVAMLQAGTTSREHWQEHGKLIGTSSG